jgi:DNA-binding PadR family transcriptional regulator
MKEKPMPGKRRVGNLLALAVLSYLAQGPMHPYELGRTLRANGGADSIRFNHGSLYMVVQQLDKAGFITGQGTSREGLRPQRTVYALTRAGRIELREWLSELLAEPQREYPAFGAALSFVSALPPDEAATLLRKRLALLTAHRTTLRQTLGTYADKGPPGLFLIEEEYRLACLSAESEFVSRLIGAITDPETPWGALCAHFHRQSRHGSGEATPPASS